MRNPWAWLTGALLGLLAWRRLRRRPAPAVDPAEELRRKLDESRGLADEREEFEAAETPIDRAEPAVDIDERRRQIHETGRAAVDEMRAPSSE